MKLLLFSLFAYGAFAANMTCDYVNGVYSAGILYPTAVGSCFYMLESSETGASSSKKLVCESDQAAMPGVSLEEYGTEDCSGTASSSTYYDPNGIFSYDFMCGGADGACTSTSCVKYECKYDSGKKEEQTACFLTDCFDGVKYKCSGGIPVGTMYEEDTCMTTTTTTLPPTPPYPDVTPSPVPASTVTCELTCDGDAANQLMKVYILAFAVVVSLFY